MKNLSIIGMFMLVGIAGNAVAASCSDQGYTEELNGDDLSGKRIEAVSPSNEEWNEDHCPDGALYKVAAPPSVDPKGLDPRAFRGTWNASVPNNVQYIYTVGGNSSYSWTLWEKPDKSAICWEGAGEIIATAPAPGTVGAPCNMP